MAWRVPTDRLEVPQITPRIKACALRCQMLTGSYAGASRSCSCPSAADCKIPTELMPALRGDPAVVRAYERNRDEYGNLNET